LTVFSLHDSVFKYFHYVKLTNPALSGKGKMRIISGTARGKKLVSFSGLKIRPTSDRVREAVFSSLFSRMGPLQGSKVLDLFAGTGAMGIEALSRGAAAAIFVDNSPQAAKVIRSNLENCGFLGKAAILQKEVQGSWPLLEEAGPFDVIFFDPPYGRGLVEKALKTITEKGLLAAEGILCVETPSDESFAEDFYPLSLVKTSNYGSTRILFFQISDERGRK